MDPGSSQDYTFCSHCNDYVSESTFRRHMDVVRRTGFRSDITRGMKEHFAAGEISDLSSESESEHGPNTDYFHSQGMCNVF